uniref:Uncharacterized protein n=1 Tax=Acrobeloides nanus TaxID=290746 RepID=A0A914EF73_9BILA
MVAKKHGCPILLFFKLLLHLAISTASSIHQFATISIQPPIIHDLVEDQTRNFLVEVGFDETKFSSRNLSNSLLRLELKSLHPEVANVDQRFYTMNMSKGNLRDGQIIYQLNTSVTGRLLGKTAIQVHLTSTNENFDLQHEFMEMPQHFEHEHQTALDLWVIRNPNWQKYDKIFVGVLVLVISIANILMGCEIDLNMVFETIKKPIAPAIGFTTQFFIMPLLAYAIAHLGLASKGLYSFALGLFVTGCAPGGGASNFWTILLNGNANLSVTMTFLSTLLSIVMIPLWMNLLGYQFLRGYNQQTTVRVPYHKICSSLVMLIIPLLIGVWIAKWKPSWGAKARKILRPFIIFVVVFLIVFGTITNTYMFRLMTWPALTAGLLLPLCGFMFGCFISILLRQPPPNVTAIAIETGVQNTGIAIMLLKFSFQEPDADISALLPVIVACSTPLPLLFGYVIHKIIKCARNSTQTARVDVEYVAEKDGIDTPKKISISLGSTQLDHTQSRPLIKNSRLPSFFSGSGLPDPNEATEEEMEYVSRVLEQVLTPGVIPD